MKSVATQIQLGTFPKRYGPAAERWMKGKLTSEMFITEGEANRFYLQIVARTWAACQLCPLARNRTKTVFGSGPTDAPLVVIGEAPGEWEDAKGLPFVGRSGILLRRVMRALGLLSQSFITNMVACRPPKNRPPAVDERQACGPRLEDILDILQPRVIVLVGASAAKWTGQRDPNVSELRGKPLPKALWPLRTNLRRLDAVFVTYHPSFVLRQPDKAHKRMALGKLVADFRWVKEALDKETG